MGGWLSPTGSSLRAMFPYTDDEETKTNSSTREKISNNFFVPSTLIAKYSSGLLNEFLTPAAAAR